VRKKHTALDDLTLWKPETPRNKWWKKVSRFIYSPLIMLLLGLVIGAYKDHLMASKVITQDLRAHMQVFEAKEDKVKMSLTVANFGNRPSTVIELLPVFPISIGSGSSGLLFNPSTVKIHGIPAIVNPGSIQSITIEDALPIKQMYESGRPDGDIHTSAIALRIRSLDFMGERYELVWKVAEISVNPERVGGWGNLSYSTPLLDKRYSSGQGIWIPVRW
jgi:hypothetical protein